MNYSIVKFNEQLGQIEIKVDEAPFPIVIDLPVDENGCVPEGEELNILINGFLPHEYVRRKKILSNGIRNIDELKSSLNINENNIEITSSIDEIKPELSMEVKLANFIEDRDARLAYCDWTQLDDVKSIHTNEWVEKWANYRKLLRDLPSTITDFNDIDSIEFPIPPIE